MSLVSDEESTGTVLVALAANLGIAVAKITAGVLSGSSAMLAEGAHSCLLYTSPSPRD